jgi:two-component system, chemotaxis family, CheB/CheR fusion protein
MAKHRAKHSDPPKRASTLRNSGVRDAGSAGRKKAPADGALVPVVGIGASAGGLEAFRQLLSALPTDTGMAFVLVQHLEPKHDSVLTTLLARATRMPVNEVHEKMHIQPDHVYVIPANADMSVVEGLLHLAARKAPAGRHLPIDYFFHSLAAARGPRATGVILSGTASDGTDGIKAIKAAGGVTFAQEPESAKFDGMPRSAIATGCVDFVLQPERIAKELAHLVKHPFAGPLDAIPALPAQEQDWVRLFRILRTAFGVDFSLYKKSTLKRRLARRMTVNKAGRLSAYLKILESSQPELEALFAELLILVTGFFRDPEVFTALRKNIFKPIMAAKPKGEPVRIWVAGCSTGQEAYSIAITLIEYLGKQAGATPIQIFATDVSEPAIEKARAGIYREDELTEVSAERRSRFLSRVEEHYFQVNHDIREMCVFARHDLTQDPPFSRLDLLSSRNVLIYFEPPLQKRALAAFHYALRPHGVLLLGRTEGLSTHSDLFTSLDRKNRFFSKNPSGHVPVGLIQALPDHLAAGKPVRETRRSIDLEKEADQMVWERYGHAGLVVSEELQILHFRGDTGPYMKPAPGKATFQLMRMLREELALEVRATLQKVRRTGVGARSEGIQLRQDRRVREVNLEVRPLGGHAGAERCFLILFEEGAAREKPAAMPEAREGEEVRKQRLRLENELARTRDYVQAIIRDQETTNEELKTANEEAMSSMEELQSTNEELETAKEELQSSNEELVTLNEQLQNGNTELAHTSDDLSNVLSGADIPIVILGQHRRIRLFTPPAERLLGLIPADVGRPIGKLRIGVNIPDFDAMIASAAEGDEVTREVQSESGRWLQLHVRPFRTAENRTEGVLLAFLDIHEIRQQREAIEKDKNLISAILDAAVDLLVVVLDREGLVMHFNRVAQQRTGYSFEDVQGRRIGEFLLAPEDVPGFERAFHNIADNLHELQESLWVTRDGRRLLISWSASVVRSEGGVESVILTGVDRTDRKEAQQRVRESEATIRALLETATEAILAIDREGRILLANAAAEKMYGYSRNQMIGREFESLVPERLRGGHSLRRKAWFDKPSHRPMEVGSDLVGLRRDGTEFPEELTLSLVDTQEGPLGVCFVSDITERKKAEETLLQYQGQLRRLTGNLFTVQESGNRDLARELHDGFSQQLAALGMEVSALLKSAPRRGPLAEPLRQLATKIRALADDIHRASRQLHPAILDELGLEAALHEESEGFSKQTGISVGFHANHAPATLPSEVSLCLYRVAQEALRNVHKHSGASSVDLSLEGNPESVAVRISDNGQGFDIEAARKKGGLGLISMEERCRLVGGALSIRSVRGEGTTVEVTVPFKL